MNKLREINVEIWENDESVAEGKEEFRVLNRGTSEAALSARGWNSRETRGWESHEGQKKEKKERRRKEAP